MTSPPWSTKGKSLGERFTWSPIKHRAKGRSYVYPEAVISALHILDHVLSGQSTSTAPEGRLQILAGGKIKCNFFLIKSKKNKLTSTGLKKGMLPTFLESIK